MRHNRQQLSAKKNIQKRKKISKKISLNDKGTSMRHNRQQLSAKKT